MSSQRNRELFARARWRRRLLYGAWAVQVGLLMAVVGVFSFRLAFSIAHFDAHDAAGRTPTVDLVWEGTNVGFAAVCLVLTGVAAGRVSSQTLTPFFLLAVEVVKMTCAFAILALDIVVYTQRPVGEWSTVALALDVVVLAAMLALAVYATVAFRRLSVDEDKGKSSSGGYGGGYEGSYNGSYNGSHDGSYDGSSNGGGYDDRHGLAKNAAAFGVGRGIPIHNNTELGTVAAAATTTTNTTNTATGDVFLRSAPLGRDAIDEALRNELWGSVITTGAVASHQAPPRALADRQVSWRVEHGDNGPPATAFKTAAPAIVERNGDVSDPDDDDDDDDDTVAVLPRGQYGRTGANEDRALLMGHSRHGSAISDEENERGPIHEATVPR